jgi:dihydropteroate synthase
MPSILACGRFRLHLERPLVMGVVNVTPDSFSDGGLFLEPGQAIAHGRRLIQEGADLLDVGGESSRPGAEGVPAAEELRRVLPVLRGLRDAQVPVAVDTVKPEVMRAALDEGAAMINDINALRAPGALEAVAASDAGVCLMHMRGEPRTMQQLATYDDVVDDVARELHRSVEEAVHAGVDPEQILIDPGIGFAKNADHNLEILARCGELRSIAPVVIGASRKAFLGHLTGRAAGPDRMVGSLAAVAAAFHGGAAVVRVHDVADTVDFLRVLAAISERERH